MVKKVAVKQIQCHNGQDLAGIIFVISDPDNSEAICDPKLLEKWLPVDLYIGGAEHAVLHLTICKILA